MGPLQRLDLFLTQPREKQPIRGVRRFLTEFIFFGVKEARACIFVGLFFLAVFLVPRGGIFHVPRYDVLLLVALFIQVWMLTSKLETLDEFKAIMLFHVVGFALEVFKTSSGIRSWSYPDFAYTKLFGVPLFSGFMYAAVGSYMIQCWRLLDVKVRNYPPYTLAAICSLVIYVNFFTHHYIGDFRWYITALVLGLYARSYVVFTPYDTPRRMPLILAFILIGFFIWLAENISTFFTIWRYPNQLSSWSGVHLGKWSSWALLVIMTFTMITWLKNIKKHVHVPV